MPKLPLYEDEPRLLRFTEGLIAEMKRGPWMFSDYHYQMAKDNFMDEQLDADPDNPPSKAMLAVMFYSTLQGAWDHDAENVCENPLPKQGFIIIGDTRGFCVMSAPQNANGYVSVLVSPDKDILCGLTAEQVKQFYSR